VSDACQAGENRVKRYNELLEKFPSWTPDTIAGLPLTQFVALFTPAENVFGSVAEAVAYLKAQQEKQKAGQ
jgi:hypothetical protein